MKIFLVGMMGCGKSYWSSLLSQELGLDLIDLDAEIEKREGLLIKDIFSEKGEDYFRRLESNVLKQYERMDQFVMATGGGVPCFYDNMEWMKHQGLTIWLNESPDAIAHRLFSEKEQRPLLKGQTNESLTAFIENKIKERSPFYGKSHVSMNGRNLTLDSLKRAIANHYNK